MNESSLNHSNKGCLCTYPCEARNVVVCVFHTPTLCLIVRLIRPYFVKTACRSFVSSAALLLVLSGVCHGLVETCEQLQAAFDLTKTQDVVVEMHPFQDIDCVTPTTMRMNSNTLTVQSSENLENFFGNSDLFQVRFEVTNGAQLIWETNVEFHGPLEQDVNGGALFVGVGSNVRFLNDLMMDDVSIISAREEDSDSAVRILSGGCVYTDGFFRVDGEASFTNCEVTGAGESPPGPGGALYVGEEGSVRFNGELAIKYVSITDDGGDNGGGIYNRGKVDIKGNAKFESLRARNGGAVFNTAGAQFRFTNQATAFFRDCTANDGFGGSLYNEGNFKFSGPALFIEQDAPTVVVSTTGVTVLSENSVFWDNEDTFEPAILVASGGELDIPSSVLFVDDVESDCSTVHFAEDDTCL